MGRGVLAKDGIDISRIPDDETIAFRMGKNSVNQKRRFFNKNEVPTCMEDVVHVYNFEKIQDKTETPVLIQAVLNGAQQNGYTDGIIFLNYE